MDLYAIWDEIVRDDIPHALITSPMIQFGTQRRSYLGATLLPEKLKRQNEFTETKITYKTFPALDGTRYSEPIMQGQQLVGSFRVTLGEVDTASQLTGHDLDNLIDLAQDNPELARAQLIQWMTNSFGISLAEKAEIQRWQAIVDAAVPLKGMDGHQETVPLPNPSQHRTTVPSGTVASPAGWYSPTYDPMPDIFGKVTLLRDKGFEINRIIYDSYLLSVLAANPIMQARLGSLLVSNSSLNSRAGLVTEAAINNYLQSELQLPALEQYNLTYSTATGTGRAHFKKQGAMVFVCTTGRDETFETGNDANEVEIITDTLGYYGIGRAVGQINPGRIVRTEAREMKPVGIYGQGFQTSFPVVTEPEAIAVLQINPPTP